MDYVIQIQNPTNPAKFKFKSIELIQIKIQILIA